MEYAEQLCLVYWTVDPDIDLQPICEQLAAEMPQHNFNGWLTKLKSYEPLFNAISMRAVLEHKRRTDGLVTEGASAKRAAKRSRPGGTTSTLEPASMQTASSKTSSQKALPPWAEDLVWPKPPPRSQADERSPNKFAYTDDELSFAEEWARTTWILEPNISRKAMSSKLGKLIPWHTGSSWRTSIVSPPSIRKYHGDFLALKKEAIKEREARIAGTFPTHRDP
ncbi:hypothetical protein CYLTODRAFT_135336 [Cylindrobasidium torrendii FP15055 ss-10]|uniref:Uncharacterized protein n=1 Tax=Cylindrobasidium torrendii FP15055 ss-10 TaxID=1314674 RepID=A0A0D7AYT8_9AGAR|nr:hypothetical protein CYLTODRAFT_135336 [Cylindrobasidium torrendii FP15055 ss-10]